MITFTKILIANRGEIACRVIAYREGAWLSHGRGLFATPTRGALHVRVADEAVRIGPPPAQRELPQHRRHPGGRANFGRRCGPSRLRLPVRERRLRRGLRQGRASSSSARRRRRSPPWATRPRAKAHDGGGRRAVRAGLRRRRPGGRDAAAKEAARIGLPLMVKAAAGGGGRGMRLVERERPAAGDRRGAAPRRQAPSARTS